ncbi:hypothetical protein AOLI_G00152130 [Acnodon oligacanthus]
MQRHHKQTGKPRPVATAVVVATQIKSNYEYCFRKIKTVHFEVKLGKIPEKGRLSDTFGNSSNNAEAQNTEAD